MRKKRPGQSILTRHDIKRAIFVDYEGSKNNPPTLLGYMIDGDVNAAIVEPCFYDCRERYKAKHAVSADHLTIVKELIHRAEKEDRVIISWREHDYNQVITALGEHRNDVLLLKKQFRNAIFSARGLRQSCYDPKAPGSSLRSWTLCFTTVRQPFTAAPVRSAYFRPLLSCSRKRRSASPYVPRRAITSPDHCCLRGHAPSTATAVLTGEAEAQFSRYLIGLLAIELA